MTTPSPRCAVLLLPLVLGGCAVDREPLPSQGKRTSDISTDMTGSSPTSTLAAAPQGEPTGELSLREALALSLLRNPDLAAAAWEKRAMEARRLQAGAWLNPSLDVAVDNVAGSSSYRGTDQAEYTVGFGQLIELGGKRSARIRQAQLEDRGAGLDYESRRLNVLNRVADAFVAVVGAQSRLVLAEQALQTAQQAVQAANDRVKAGKSAPVEATRARLAHTEARLALSSAQRHLATLRE